MARTAATAPPTDPRLWRRALAQVHPDKGGSEELFVFLTAAREVIEEHLKRCPALPPGPGPGPGPGPRPPHGDQGGDQGEESGPPRVPFDAELGYAENHHALVLRALEIGEGVGEPYGGIFALLVDCQSVNHGRGVARQSRGATYKQLAAIGHTAGLDSEGRSGLYEIARAVPLSESMAHHILQKLKGG